MGFRQDLLVFAGIFLILFSGAYAVGAVSLPGTVTLPNWFGGDAGGEEPRYNVYTTVDVATGAAGAIIDESSFDYDTKRCGLACSLSFAGTPNLALLGVDDVNMQISLINSDGVKVAEVDKFIGEIGAIQTETVDQSFSNIPAGRYQVKYVLTGEGSLGNTFENTLTKEIRVPETIQQGGGN